jgi:Nucleoporin Nup120/160
MAPNPRARYLYTETRLNLDPAYPSATIHLQVPSTSSTWNPLTAVSNSLSTSTTASPIHDEATFSRTHLANDASIYFRRSTRSPRSFLWRLLSDRTQLELQAVDLTQTAASKTEALLTLTVQFPSPIRPYGLAFGDPEERDALVVFALTVAGELYTLNLHKDLFVHPKAAEALPPDWCKSFTPPALRIRDAYRLFAPSVDQLLLSMTDGAIVQLQKEPTSDGSHWNETFFSAQSWSLSLPRKLAKWRGETFIRYGDTELDSLAAASVVMSPDEENIITVCLNHTLRIWNVSTGKVTLQTDLTETNADSALTKQNQPKFLLGPNQRQLLQVLDTPGQDGDKYYIVTFSPKQHQFIFWAVLDADSGFDGVRRVQEEFEFTPPIEDLMDTSSWNLEEFYVRANRGWTDTQLWLRARAGPVSRIFKVQFSLFDDMEDLERAWNTEWTAVAAGRQSTEYLNLDIPAELQSGDSGLHCPNVTEKWLEFLFYPGRFTVATLETALHVYSKGLRKDTGSQSKASLKERLSDAVLSKAYAHTAGSNPDVQEIHTWEQWHIFYGLVQELHKRRATTLSFAMDTEDRLPWIVCADSISPIRMCTDLDICDFHRSPERNVPTEDLIAKRLDSTYEVLDLLHVAHVFRSSLSTSFQDHFRRAVLAEVVQEPSTSVRDRMLTFHEDADLATGVSQEDWDRFNLVLEESGGFDVLDYASFIAILEQLDQPSEGKDHDERITRYGARALIRTAQETLSLNVKTLLDLLLLTVFVEVEVDEQELTQSMQSVWRGQDIFIEVLAKLKEHAVLDFLMRNMRTERPKRPRRSSISESPSALKSSQSQPEILYTSTLMESLFIGDWSTIHYREDAELPDLITYWARRWTASQGLSTQYDSFTEHVFADLIKHSNEALCSDFLSFVPSTFWGIYLKGRFYLSQGSFDMAAMSFRKAAFGLCKCQSLPLPIIANSS